MTRALALALGALFLGACSCRDESGEPTASASSIATDGRISYLLAPCAKNQNYDVDTSDALPILLEMLLRGQRDPLRRAREELSQRGAEGVKTVSRVIDASQDSAAATGNLRNAIDVLSRSDDPSAREPLLRLVTYREQSIAILAAEGLRKHGRPEDFEAVWGLLEIAPPELRSKLLPTLHALDALRAERLYLDWIEGGQNDDLWEFLVLDLAASTDAGVQERCRALWPKLQPRFQFPIAAASARGGDERALGLLREALRSSNPGIREAALESLGRAEFARELAEVARSEADPTLRARAMAFLSEPEHIQEFLPVLRAALGDSDEGVSSGAALELAKLGDSSAIEHCLQALDDPSSQAFDGALRALREPMSRDAALAKRVYERLRSRRDSEAELPIEARTQVLAAIGQVPLEEAARALYEQSRGQTGGVGDMPASRWLVLQAANTGEVGQRLLYASFAGETDARRRIDLLEGIALRANEFAQQALVELLDGEQLTPYETLYAADRLTRMAPVEVAAPLLKRVTLRIAHPDVRPALQCLLWSNYPGPN